jgi:hypothetical protein
VTDRPPAGPPPTYGDPAEHGESPDYDQWAAASGDPAPPPPSPWTADPAPAHDQRPTASGEGSQPAPSPWAADPAPAAPVHDQWIAGTGPAAPAGDQWDPRSGPAGPGGPARPAPGPWAPGSGDPAAPAHAQSLPGSGEPAAAASGQWAGAGDPAAGPWGAGPYGAPGDGAPGPYGVPRPRVRLWPPRRAEWLTAAAVVAALAVVGAALAPLWVHLAPRLAFRVDQPGRALPVVPEAEEYVAADGRFVLLTLAAGVLAALACWFVKRSRGPLVLLALAAGGLLGAVVTWRLGLRLGTGYRPEDLQTVGNTVHQPLTLRAKAGLVVEPIAAVVLYLLTVGFSSRNDLGQDDEEPLSSGSG